MERAKFIHIHNHSEYSLLDGLCRISELVKAAIENDMPALGLTDHGNMFGAIKFYKECVANNIRPIIGCEFYLAPDKLTIKENINTYKYFHLNLFAKNFEGYRNLLKLNAIAYLQGFYYKPRIDREVLTEYSEGLICTSSCILGDIPQYLLLSKFEEAYNLARYYQVIFEDDFYIEIQNHNLKNEINVLPEMVKLANELKIPIVAANDVHYIKKEDASTHDVLLKINTGAALADIDSLSFENSEFYFKSQQEMVELFSEYPEAVENTKEIATKCDLELFLRQKFYFPEYKTPESKNSFDYLKEKCEENLEAKYPKKRKEAAKRLDYELKIIKEKNFENYFLIISDLVDYAKKNNILVGPGRGSAAGSITSYLLEITSIDPIKYNLLFERFLNSKRKKMPDIDLDFEHCRRDDLFKYLQKQYGENCVVHIISYGTLKERNSIRDVARVYEIDQDSVSKLIGIIENLNNEFNMEKLGNNKEYLAIKNQYPELDNVVIKAHKLLNLTRHVTTHPAGIIISPKDINKYVPLYFDQKSGLVVSQYDMHSIEAVGLLKIDILALKTLTIIKDTLQNIDTQIDLLNLNLNDKKVFKLFQTGKAIGVFQFDTKGIRDLLVKLQPQYFQDIIAAIAMYRPGVLQSGMVDDYINAKSGINNIKYLHENLKPVLKDTYGVILYQEQVMQIANIIAGYSLEEADILRIAMSKKNIELMEEQRVPFINGAIKKGYSDELAAEIFNLIEKFAGYGFNKSHSAAYAMLTYQTAYLKAYHPLEYMVSILNYEDHLSGKVPFYIKECVRLGFEFIGPDFNDCQVQYSIVDEKIKIGLIAVKNVGEKLSESIVNEQKNNGPYESLIDFTARNLENGLNKHSLESLIKAGLFDSFYKSREILIDNFRLILDKAEHLHKTRESKMLDIFGDDKTISDEDEFQKKLTSSDEKDIFRNIIFEREVLGFYYSDNPLNKYINEIKLFSNIKKAEDLSELEKVKLIAVIGKIEEKINSQNNEFAEIEFIFLKETFKGYVFSNEYHVIKSKLRLNNIYFIEGTYDNKYQGVIINNVCNINELYKNIPRKLYFRLNKKYVSEQKILNIKNLLDSFVLGNVEVYFYVEYMDNKHVLIRAGKKIALDKQNIIKLLDLIDIDNIKIV